MDAIYCFTKYHESWLSVVENLHKSDGWDPKYFIAPSRFKGKINLEYPNVKFHSRERSAQGIPPKSSPNYFASTEPIHANEIIEMGEDMYVANQMLDRQDPGNVTGNHFPNKLRRHYIYDTLSYWKTILRDIQPDVIVFNETPHLTSEYLLYAFANYIDIDTIIVQQTRLPDHFFTMSHLSDIPNPLQRTDTHDSKVSFKTKEYLEEIRNKNTLGRNSKVLGSNYRLGEFLNKYIQKTFSVNGLKKILHAIQNEYKETDHSLIFNGTKSFMTSQGNRPDKSNLSIYDWLVFRMKAKYYNQRLEKYYLKQTTKVRENENYLYFPLHYQPERTTSPEGGIYADQYLIAKTVSHHLPNKWKLYIREHPAQWKDNRFGELGRTKEEYDRFLSLEGVELMNPEISPYEIMKYSEGVVTVTGTSGWEAIIRGKPSIVFGKSAWYREAPGVLYVKSEDQVNKAINKIARGLNVEKDKLYEYVGMLESIGHNGAPNKMPSTLSRDNNIKNISEAIKNKYYD